MYVRTLKNPPPGTRRPTGDAPWHIVCFQYDVTGIHKTKCGKVLSKVQLRSSLFSGVLCKACDKIEQAIMTKEDRAHDAYLKELGRG